MSFHVRPDALIIDTVRFNDEALIANRVAAAPVPARTAVGKLLRFLYCDEGPQTLNRDQLVAGRQYLDPAESVLIQFLYNCVVGKKRAAFGPRAAKVARDARYRCEACGDTDVRVLTIDHVSGRVAGTALSCVCANCHMVKSRRDDWSGSTHPASLAVAADDDAED